MRARSSDRARAPPAITRRAPKERENGNQTEWDLADVVDPEHVVIHDSFHEIEEAPSDDGGSPLPPALRNDGATARL
jgi:hypothetical protein